MVGLLEGYRDLKSLRRVGSAGDRGLVRGEFLDGVNSAGDKLQYIGTCVVLDAEV